MSCPYCKSEEWHSSTVCDDCGLPYGRELPKAMAVQMQRIDVLEKRLKEAEDLLRSVTNFTEIGYHEWLKRRYIFLTSHAV